MGDHAIWSKAVALWKWLLARKGRVALAEADLAKILTGGCHLEFQTADSRGVWVKYVDGMVTMPDGGVIDLNLGAINGLRVVKDGPENIEDFDAYAEQVGLFPEGQLGVGQFHVLDTEEGAERFSYQRTPESDPIKLTGEDAFSRIVRVTCLSFATWLSTQDEFEEIASPKFIEAFDEWWTENEKILKSAEAAAEVFEESDEVIFTNDDVSDVL